MINKYAATAQDWAMDIVFAYKWVKDKTDLPQWVHDVCKALVIIDKFVSTNEETIKAYTTVHNSISNEETLVNLYAALGFSYEKDDDGNLLPYIESIPE